MRAAVRPVARAGGLIVCAALTALLVACSPTAATPQPSSSTASASPTAQPTAATQPTATPIGANPCGASSSAEVASRLNAWSIPTPAGAIVVDQGAQESAGPAGSIEYLLTGACAKSSSPDDVWAFYAARMPASGWTQSATVPTAGGSSAPCGYKYCWTKDGGHGAMLMVTLKNMVAKGSDTEFTIVYAM
jgi:serine-type D-Ala-D-Ala carboxypeptidase/endopeptidase (penicillin-binding protein 4)